MWIPVVSIARLMPFHEATIVYFCLAVSGNRLSVGGGPQASRLGTLLPLEPPLLLANFVSSQPMALLLLLLCVCFPMFVFVWVYVCETGRSFSTNNRLVSRFSFCDRLQPTTTMGASEGSTEREHLISLFSSRRLVVAFSKFHHSISSCAETGNTGWRPGTRIIRASRIKS